MNSLLFRSTATAFLLTIFLGMFLPATSTAATIIWGGATNISGDSDVATNGTLFIAANVGNNASTAAGSIWGPATATTVNGVAFGGYYLNTMLTTGGPAVSNQALFSPISVNNSALGLTIQGTNNTTFGTGSAFTSLSSSYQSLLGQGAYANTGVNVTLTLSSLSVGQAYQIQWWTNDSRSLAASGRTVTATAGNAVTLDSNTASSGTGLGQYAIGTFTADAATQAIVFSGSAGVQISAFQVAAIPEPSTYALLGLGLVSLVALRRRQAK